MSSRGTALVDQCFTGTGEDSGWSWFGGPMAGAPSFILDPVSGLTLGMLVLDQTQDPLAG